MATQHDIRFTLFTTSSYHFDVINFKLNESLSEPFQLTLSVSSSDANVDFGQLLDEPVTFTFWQDDKIQRRINGIISRVRQGQTGFRRSHYTFVIEPELVRTQLRSNCRIFQQKDVTEIIAELLKESGNKNVTFDTRDTHDPREYCVQYRETDFDFIKRLAAEEGLVYTFEHAKDQHHLIFSDQLHHGPVQSEVLYNPKPSAQQPEPALRKFEYTEQLKTDEHRMRDYTFTHPRYNLEHSHHGHNNIHAKEGKRAEYQKFDFPGRYKSDAQGSPFNRYRLEYERRDTQQVTAHGDDMRPQPGHVIALNQHDNWHFTGNWLVTRVEHSGQQPQSQGEDSASSESGSRYTSTLTLIPHGQAWRATPIHKPAVDGAHIAHVVGPAGEEIYCDEHGRVKVQFPWDRYGSRDEHSSCWIRVSQDWGGAGWGHMAIPRIGHEVIVDFLEGDPDQPIVTGRTYHANNMPPYALPEHKTRTTIKSQTHKGIGFNELRFEDEAGQEEIFIHAQKDQNNIVQNDETTRVGHDRSEDIGNDETINIGNDRTEDVLNDETLSVVQDQRETIGRDRFQVIERNRTTRIDKDFIEKVNNHRIESTYANHFEEVGGHYVNTVNGNYSLEVVDTITSQTTKHLSTASEKMHIQGPGGSITIDSGGVTFKASQINIQAGSVAFNGGGAGGVQGLSGVINTGFKPDIIEVVEEDQLSSEYALEQHRGLASKLEPFHFISWTASVFGYDIPIEAYEALHKDLKSGAITMPEIKIVKGKFAAYDNEENIIVIGSAYLHPALDDDQKAQSRLFHILIEEYGHHIDYLLRNKYSDIGGDAPKDEGAIFAFLIADIAYDRQPELVYGQYAGEKGDQVLSLDFSVPYEMIAGKPRKEYIDLDGKTEDGRYEFFSAGRGKTHHGEYGHQSVEDVLDRAKFDEIDRLEVYYGNWLRDYSQVVDTKLLEMDLETMLDGVKSGTDATTEAIIKATEKARKEGITDPEEIKKITDSVIQSREAINKAAEAAKQNAPSSDQTLNGTLAGGKKVTQKHISRESLTKLVEVLARVEFEQLFNKTDTAPYRLTTKKLGVYLPHEHLDNPLGIQATTADPDFRGAYKASEGAIDQQHWYKSYFDDSRRYVQQQLTLAAQKGETPEGRIHFGQALHVMEDLYAHGNFIELLLLRIHNSRSLAGESPKWIKPKVWVEETKLNNGKKVYPLVTGSFGSADTIASFLSILQKHMSKEVLFEPGVRSAGMQIMLIFLKDYDLKTYETINSNLTWLEECQREHWPCRIVGQTTHFLFSQVKEWINGLIAYMASQVLAEMPRNQQQLPTDPTHTQLAKDHGEHPLHTLAVVCARIMVDDLGRHMKATWSGKISVNEFNKRAQAYFIHPDKINTKSIPPLKRMVEDANLWANASPSKVAEAASYQGDLDHAREELEALANQSSVFGKRSYEFMLWLYEIYKE